MSGEISLHELLLVLGGGLTGFLLERKRFRLLTCVFGAMTAWNLLLTDTPALFVVPGWACGVFAVFLAIGGPVALFFTSEHGTDVADRPLS